LSARELRREVASFGESLVGIARLGVVLCAALTLVVGVWWLFNDALPGQDHWASLNSSQSYMERTFPSDEFIGSGHVAEDARLWMPRDARYRVLVGQKYENSPWGWAAPNFLAGFLFPRKQAESGSASWVFCLGCDVSALGEGFERLSDGGNGVVFGRVTR
jgi:hypothetical protein